MASRPAYSRGRRGLGSTTRVDQGPFVVFIRCLAYGIDCQASQTDRTWQRTARTRRRIYDIYDSAASATISISPTRTGCRPADIDLYRTPIFYTLVWRRHPSQVLINDIESLETQLVPSFQ
ncbi:hypothetical protein GY45DRAFT_492723 [Cubamyces sp. BRFM 1775]|nr:hypothetical protein GY45DRAFT_492723 [Cubamyces sp. BRFM 1775]